MTTFLEQTIFTAIWKGNLNGVKTLVDSKNIECFDAEHHRTPLSWACFYGNKTIVPHLVDIGANIECRDKHERTPLITASYSGHLHTVNYLLDKGANIEAKDDAGITALMAACTNGFLAVAKALIKRGADVNTVSNDGSTCMSVANKGDFKSIVRLLFENGCNIPQAYQKLGGSNSKSQSQSEDQGDKDNKIAPVVPLGSISIEQAKSTPQAVDKPLNPDVARKPSNYDLAYSSSNSTSFVLGPASKPLPSIQPTKSASPVSNVEETELRQATPINLEPSLSHDNVEIKTITASPVKSQVPSKETTPIKPEPTEVKQSSPEQAEVIVVPAEDVKQATPVKTEEATLSFEANPNDEVALSKEEVKETEQVKLAEAVADMTEETSALNIIKEEVTEIEQEENNDRPVNAVEHADRIEEVKVDLLQVEKVVNSDMLAEIAATIAQVAEAIHEEVPLIGRESNDSEYGEIITEDDIVIDAKEEVLDDSIHLKKAFTSVLHPDSGNTAFKISLDDVDSDDD